MHTTLAQSSQKVSYHTESAGSRLTTKIPVATTYQTVGEVSTAIREVIRKFETINYIYVVDGDQKLVGVFSIRELFRHKPEAVVKSFMTTQLISVKHTADQ